MMKRVGLLIVVVACVKGDPIEVQPGHGGTIAVPDCGYSVTTVDGAEAPELSNAAVIGPDPTPRLVHLGLVGDPKTSAALPRCTTRPRSSTTTESLRPSSAVDAGAQIIVVPMTLRVR